MTFTVSGADPADTTPEACVARFLFAGVARDNDGAAAELHPDSRAELSGTVESPPGVIGAAIQPAEPAADGVHVPTLLDGPDGTQQRFVFVVKPVDEGWGIHLGESLAATFGGDPMQMMQEAMTAAVAPLGEAFNQIGEAMNDAFGGGAPAEPPVRRLAIDEPMPSDGAAMPTAIGATVSELDWRRRVQRSDGETTASSELTARCVFALDAAWTATACTGVTVDEAVGVDGEDLRIHDVGPDFASENYASWEQERHEVYARIPLAAPAGPFAGLATLSGSARFAVVGGDLLEIDLGTIGSLLGRSVHIAAFGIELAVERDGEGCPVLRAPYGWFDRLAELRLVAADGERISENWSGSGDGETSTRVYQNDIPDEASIRLRFHAQVGTVELPFACADLPLTLS